MGVALTWKGTIQAETRGSQKINVFWSTQLTWEYKICVQQQQENVPLQNSACPGNSLRVKIQSWYILVPSDSLVKHMNQLGK
jgi:hypothetical protein